jgi:tetratricopeptide (TPR) repeat protein
VTQEEIRAEVNTRGMAPRPEESVMEALSWTGADAATIKAIQHASGRRPNSERGLKRPQPWDVLVEVARELRQNAVDEAIGTLREAIEKQLNNAWMHFVLASLMGREEDWLSAYDESSKAVRFAPQSPYIQGQYSYVCSRTGLGQPAEIHARKMLALRPKDAVAHHALGMALETEGRTEEALQAYEEAARLQPNLAAQLNRGEIEASIAAYEKAVHLDSKQALYYCGLGWAYRLQANYGKAIESFKRAKGLALLQPEVRQYPGNAYFAAKRYPEAVKEFQELAEKEPDWEPARLALAKALRAEGRIREADQILLGPVPEKWDAAPH